MIYLVLVVTVLIVPLNKYFERLILLGHQSASWMTMPLAIVGALSLVCFLVSMSVGLNSIQRDY